MRLSLMKAAHVALFGTAYRKYGYLPGFGRCGIQRPSTPPILGFPHKLCSRDEIELKHVPVKHLFDRTTLSILVRAELVNLRKGPFREAIQGSATAIGSADYRFRPCRIRHNYVGLGRFIVRAGVSR
jgi:hypothetical protein